MFLPWADCMESAQGVFLRLHMPDQVCRLFGNFLCMGFSACLIPPVLPSGMAVHFFRRHGSKTPCTWLSRTDLCKRCIYPSWIGWIQPPQGVFLTDLQTALRRGHPALLQWGRRGAADTPNTCAGLSPLATYDYGRSIFSANAPCVSTLSLQ